MWGLKETEWKLSNLTRTLTKLTNYVNQRRLVIWKRAGRITSNCFIDNSIEPGKKEAIAAVAPPAIENDARTGSATRDFKVAETRLWHVSSAA